MAAPQVECHFFLNSFDNEVFSMTLPEAPAEGDFVRHQSSSMNVKTRYRVKEKEFTINSTESWQNKINILLELWGA